MDRVVQPGSLQEQVGGSDDAKALTGLCAYVPVSFMHLGDVLSAGLLFSEAFRLPL